MKILITAALILVCFSLITTVIAQSPASSEIKALSTQLAADPENGELYLKRAAAYCSAGAFDKGIADYNWLIKKKGNIGLLYEYRGECLLKKGDKPGALKDLEKAGYANYGRKDYNGYMASQSAFARMIQIDPQSQVGYMGRGLAGYELTVITDGLAGKDAISDLTKAISLTSDKVGRTMALFYRGKAYFDIAQYDKAIADLSAAVALSPKVAKLYKERAIVYRRAGRAELAAADDQKAELYNFEPRFQTASQYRRENKYDLAIIEYTKILEIDDQYADAFERRGATYLILGKADLALEDYSRAIQINPEAANLYRVRADLLEKANRPDLALQDYTKAIELEPNHYDWYAARGALLSKLDQFDMAISDYTDSIRLARESQFGASYILKGIYFRANLYRTTKQFDLAVKDYEILIKLLQASPSAATAAADTYHQIGHTRFEQEKFDLAAEAFTTAIAGTKDPSHLYSDRSKAFVQQKKYDLALADATTAIETGKNKPVYYLERAKIYATQGKFDPAHADLAKSVELNPNLYQAYALRAMIYCDQGKKEMAQADEAKVTSLGGSLTDKCW